jgi:hypothetical protein
MKLTSLALFASFALAGYVEAQTTPQEQAPAPAESTPHKSHTHPLSGACRQEVSKVCGTAHGSELMGCVKGNLDTNKFSAACQSQLKEHLKPQTKPAS